MEKQLLNKRTCHSGLELLPKAESPIIIDESFFTKKTIGWVLRVDLKCEPYIPFQEKPVDNTAGEHSSLLHV